MHIGIVLQDLTNVLGFTCEKACEKLRKKQGTRANPSIVDQIELDVRGLDE